MIENSLPHSSAHFLFKDQKRAEHFAQPFGLLLIVSVAFRANFTSSENYSLFLLGIMNRPEAAIKGKPRIEEDGFPPVAGNFLVVAFLAGASCPFTLSVLFLVVWTDFFVSDDFLPLFSTGAPLAVGVSCGVFFSSSFISGMKRVKSPIDCVGCLVFGLTVSD